MEEENTLSPQKPPFKERRKHRRVETTVQVAVLAEDIEEVFVESRNMSLGGVLLRTENPLDNGMKVFLRFYFPDYRGPMEVEGRVVSNRGMNGVAIEFTGIDPETENIMKKYLLAKEKQQGL